MLLPKPLNQILLPLDQHFSSGCRPPGCYYRHARPRLHPTTEIFFVGFFPFVIVTVRGEAHLIAVQYTLASILVFSLRLKCYLDPSAS